MLVCHCWPNTVCPWLVSYSVGLLTLSLIPLLGLSLPVNVNQTQTPTGLPQMLRAKEAFLIFLKTVILTIKSKCMDRIYCFWNITSYGSEAPNIEILFTLTSMSYIHTCYNLWRLPSCFFIFVLLSALLHLYCNPSSIKPSNVHGTQSLHSVSACFVDRPLMIYQHRRQAETFRAQFNSLDCRIYSYIQLSKRQDCQSFTYKADTSVQLSLESRPLASVHQTPLLYHSKSKPLTPAAAKAHWRPVT